MAKFPNITITQNGLNAIAKATNEKIIYTHICLGDGVLSDEDNILDFTDLKNKKLTADITDITNDSNSQITLQTIVSNKVVDEGFYAREIGIYAKSGADGEEFLYAYANASDNCDYLPDNSQPIDELKLKITLLVGNVDNVTAIINSSIIFITLADCQREIEKHNLNANAHGKVFAKKNDVYTKTETNDLLKNKANVSHGNHVPSLETANNARFLRNDNTWSTVTPANIGAPTKTGAGASGTWNIDISGNAKSASSATSAIVAKQLGKNGTSDGMTFNWSGQNGQPSWLWGGNDGTNMYVYNPSNFNVNYARSAGSATNATNATNADKLDGKHLAEIYSCIGGRKQPTMTPLMDRVAMCKAANASTAEIDANIAKINKSRNWTQTIWNNSTGIRAYGGDFGFKDYRQGTVLLNQDFRNFDRIMFFFSNDNGNHTRTIIFDSWELWWSMENSWRVSLCKGGNYGGAWNIFGSNTELGTDKHSNKYSSPTVLQCYEQSAGIIEIYGLNY